MSGRSRDRRQFTDDEAARMLGVSGRTVRKWRARGWLVATRDGRLDRAATIANVNRYRDPTLGGRTDRLVGGAAPIGSLGGVAGVASGDSGRLLKARVLHEALLVKSLQLELDVREGRKVDLEDAKRTYVNAITDARTRVEAIPDRVAARLIGLDAGAIREVLRAEFEAALQGVDKVPFVGSDGDDVEV